MVCSLTSSHSNTWLPFHTITDAHHVLSIRLDDCYGIAVRWNCRETQHSRTIISLKSISGFEIYLSFVIQELYIAYGCSILAVLKCDARHWVVLPSSVRPRKLQPVVRPNYGYHSTHVFLFVTYIYVSIHPGARNVKRHGIIMPTNAITNARHVLSIRPPGLLL